MLSTDEPITLLIEKLDALARPDRAAILKRLSSRQRDQVARFRAGRRLAPPEGHSPDFTQRIAALDKDKSILTPAAREALRRAVTPEVNPPRRETARGASLADAAGSLFRKRGSA